ncbi:MAG TPA: AraC family transcriptional regulator [Noviherbaspirillum sp.]|jgi:AraC-like DNA-binding protein|uniref:AraC family transcriptional regulator n=1 Tax=Noviherbaspirillum sp. TaxID=1926288 RepID=UPI002DDD54E3|nr:AraC family transcriptional regulator [Noviherbaspirillum sp.]HEV2612200.1 AraC family transcriptional regulator [Noviherbaspirillum sp.]
MAQMFRDTAVYWRSPLLPDAELLTAEYYGQEFAPHWHDSYSIPIIRAGAQTYRYRGGKRFAAVGGIAAINPGEIHTGERASEHGWAYRAFYPSVEWMRGLASDIAGRRVDAPWLPDDAIVDPETAAMLATAHRMLEEGADMLGADTALTAAFALLLSRHARERPQPQPLQSDGVRVARMQARMAEDLTQALTLSELAATVGLSPFHAARLFSAAVGMPPHAWRNQLRLNRALGLLRQGTAVAEVAAATGFADQSHFTRHFKRAYGASPGHWQAA